MSKISKNTFYGKTLIESHAQHQSRVRELSSSIHDSEEAKIKRRRLLGPSEFWGEFWRQQEALLVADQGSSNSMHTFVLQYDEGYRKFIVAHPEIYWLVDESRPKEQRCSYEVIPDGSPCHLYFDLEFGKDLNPSSDGSKMTKTLIDVFCAHFLEHWGFPCRRSEVLSLDSTTDVKFSRHLVFRVKNVMFKNNQHAGRFVKTICSNIRQSLLLDNATRSSVDNILSRFHKEDLAELFINTTKGKELFVDEGVYTRNRHFRIYKSTKLGKNSHLTVSDDSEYILSTTYTNKELGLFLDSLISYVPSTKNLILLEYQDKNSVDAIKYSKECLSQRRVYVRAEKKIESPYPDIDKFILDIVKPGKIREVKLLNNSVMLYAFIDHRYCANIGRPHKSNGVYWVVDLNNKVAFQKCYDHDCAGFKSAPRELPEKICFEMDKETDILLSSVPDPQDCSLRQTDNFVALEDDDLELANIDLP
ncbi:DNA-directed primase/polymerase protein [Neodiprion pinetum]|uniref:DNA-directed primase/polymerase protein n=1 Tax=Neodiprion lecontei TaxID=441921 RepID=A0A6J0CCT0_NEOLC|nr:DNA-directed primase/polymerase protein [Neodiprion lecontei]XP_046487187.1 DNA-directed primase/polymerase protein-like [Neodiprion pinetum]